MSSPEMDEQQYQEFPVELLELGAKISMQLGIPLLDNPIDINFITECVNTILGGLNPKWKPINFQPKNEQQQQQAWKKIFHIVQSAMLPDHQKILQSDQEIGMQNFILLFQVLYQGCQALRVQNLQPISNSQIKKNLRSNNNNNMKINKKQSIKKQSKKVQRKYEEEPKQIKRNSQQKTQKGKKEVKERPKTGKVKNIYGQKLEQEIIQNVVKTMQKKYQTKAEPHRIARIRQKEGTEIVQKAKRNLDYAIKDYQISNRLAENRIKKQSKNPTKKNVADNAYLKMIENKHKKLNNEIENQQLRYYLQLRDKKVAYIRHIHKLIQKLQKQRQIQSHKKQRELQILKKKEMIQKIETVQNLFSHNMSKLKQNYEERRKVEQLQNVGEIQVCRAMEKSIKQKKAKEMQSIKDLWNQQRNQLFKITGDEQKMKNKLIQIYRKNRIR